MELVARLPAGDLIVFGLAVLISLGAFAARRWGIPTTASRRRLLESAAL